MSVLAEHALACLASGNRQGAVTMLADPGDPAEHAVLGMAYLDGAFWGAAYGACRRALAAGAATAGAMLNLALAEDRLALDGRPRMRALMAACPDWDEPPLRLAESARRAGDAAGAIRAYERVLDLRPNRPEALLGLGVLLLGQGEPARAQMLLVNCCGVTPASPEVWDALGIAFMATGDHGLAESAFAESLRLAPGGARVALRRIDAALAAGTADAELARLEFATLRNPLDIVQLTARGVLLDRLGRAEEAVDILEAAAALSPDAPLPAAALAAAQLHAGRFAQAVPALQRAAALSPNDLAINNDLAAALNRVHRYREGREILERLIAEHGEQPALLCNLCVALVSLGMQREGVEAARRATVVAPEVNLGWRTLSNAMAYCTGTTGAGLLDVCRQASATLGRGEPVAVPRPSGPDRRLRVGLLSAALRTHPVGWLTIAGFESLDPDGFELVCFGQAESTDPMQRRFRSIAGEWHSVAGQPAAQVAATIRAARIDMLIDLGGWGDQGLLGVCARRPAPVQIKWVGMQNHSTGLPEMDWMITDRWETPPGTEHLYSERLLRLPDGYVCYSPPADAPDVSLPPVLARGAITFGCFNNLAKITPDAIGTWASILRRVAGARIVLKTHQFSDRQTVAALQAAFARHGVPASRTEFRGSSTHRGQLAQHADIDIVLDPFPYSGGLTTCEALWMGVPVVTMPGELFASRHSASHVCNAGLADWVAQDATGYQEIAVSRATDIDALAGLRAGLRAQMRASPLCDQRRFGRNLGNALRSAWRDACAS
jgi:predicted O-linked N-acetylglucosamine transferase (SPINDLY family)